MTSRLRRFEEECRNVPDEVIARLDARAMAPGYVPSKVEWLDAGPDPFGLDWKWTLPEPEEAVQPKPTAVASVALPARRKQPPIAAYVGGAALAACLLLALGALIGFQSNRGRDAIFAARVTIKEDVARGGGVSELTIENQAGRVGFVTLVSLTPGRRPAVFYREGGQFISVDPKGTRTVRSLPAIFDDARAALVIMTATPAGEAVQVVMPEGASLERTDLVEVLKSSLERLGFRGVAVDFVSIPAPRH